VRQKADESYDEELNEKHKCGNPGAVERHL
jgi:hypothetical protein